MRRLLSSSAIMLAALAVSSPALAGQHDAVAHEPADEPPEGDDEGGDDEEGLELEDEMEAAPSDPDADGDVNFDASFLAGGDKAKAEADADAASKAAAGDAPGLTPEEQQAIDEKMITVVQRQAFLNVFNHEDEPEKKIRRLELSPQVGISVNDPYVRHYSAGAEANLWLTNRFALGIHGHGFFGDRTPAYDRIRFQEQTLLTANEYLWQASLGVTYEPFYGKIAIFNRRLMHWEANVGLAGGVIHSRILPRFESLHQPFDSILPQGNLTIGSRYYVSGWEWVSFNFAVRTFAWMDKYEPFTRGPATSGEGDTADDQSLDLPDNAKAAADSSLAFNTMVYVGLSLYLPPRFNYSTRR